MHLGIAKRHVQRLRKTSCTIRGVYLLEYSFFSQKLLSVRCVVGNSNCRLACKASGHQILHRRGGDRVHGSSAALPDTIKQRMF